ncbi:MAG: hypothetical protein K2K53_12810 [Oscillospiraceae bacterium]|nr:hypothetical protein [Oscillospiraceae bacterium]
MADLLGATNPVPGYDNTAINRNIPVSPDNTQIQNVPDPSRVTGADNRTEQQDASQEGQQVRYDSNFQTFLQQLRQGQDATQILSALLVREGTVVSSGMSEGIAEEISQAVELLKMDEGQLLKFLGAQMKAGTRFGGALFAMLRNAYARADSPGVRGDILNFLKSYSDYSSTAHLEGNLLRNLAGMADAMPASWGDKLRELTAQLANGIAAGDRQGNISFIQQEIFPYMSSYVSQTHDLGTPRALLSLLALDLARYENGSEEKLSETFHQLAGYGTLKGMLGGIDDKSLLKLLQSSQPKESNATRFIDHMAAAAARALRGEGSAEVQQTFRNLVSSILINESVYMPIAHFLIPLEMDGRKLFSEMWVDADAEDKKDGGGRGGKCMRFLFKIDVERLGLFDVILTSRDKEVEVAVACPEGAAPFTREIEDTVSQILTRNDLKPSGVSVRKMERPVTLTEVFPKIFEGKNSVNVKV